MGREHEIGREDVLDGKYRILRRLGSGGMGVVYVARRIALGDLVAIKCIHPDRNTGAARARFLREAQAAARVRHPNVVQVFDFGQQSDTPYLVMEYLEGPTLHDLVHERGALPVARALSIFASVCAAVEAGHRRRVVHRDIKPHNVILARTDDGRELVKVLDFGLARFTDGAEGLTGPGALMGTINFMAPEQAEGGDVGPAADVFALGAVLYNLVTARLPFEADNEIRVLLRMHAGEFDPPRRHVPDLPQELVLGIEAALQRDPAARPATPSELARRVGVAMPDPVEIDHTPQPGSAPDEARLPNFDSMPGTMIATARPPSVARPGSRSPELDRYVGRQEALDALLRHHQAALRGQRGLALVVGDSGVGKSRLIRAHLDALRRDDVRVVSARFFAYEGDRPPPLETFAWMVTDGHGSVAPGRRPGGEAVAGEKWQSFGELAQAFAERAGTGMLVVALEDLQWASATDLELVAYLAQTAAPERVRVIATVRLEALEAGRGELARWTSQLTGQRLLERIVVRPFTPTEVRAWLDAAFGRLRIRAEDLRRIERLTQGKPFYLAEVVRRLLENGSIVRDTEAWVCSALDDIVLPESVQSLVEAQLVALDDECIDALETASVVGQEFRIESVAAATDLPEARLEAALERAVRARLLTDRDLAPGSDYGFREAIVRTVLYSRLGARRRRRLHARVVDGLARLYAGEADRIAPVLAYHEEAIERWDSALAWALLATERALQRHDVDGAATDVRRARRALEGCDAAGLTVRDRDRARYDRAAGAVDSVLGRFAEAEGALRSAAERAARCGDKSLRLDALLDLAEARLGRGDLAGGAQVGIEALAAAQALDDKVREHAARIRIAACLGPLGRLEEAGGVLAPTLERTDVPALARLRAFALREAAWLEAKHGNFAEALWSAREAHQAALATGDALAQYRAVSGIALVLAESGDLAAAVPELERALGLARSLSLRRREGIELGNLGETLHLLGRHEDGLERVRDAIAIFVEIGDRASEGDARVNLGRMLLAVDRKAEALETLRVARDACAASGRREYEGIAALEMARVHLAERAAEQARARFAEAREAFAACESFMLWRAELGLARAELLLGREDAAREHAALASDLLGEQRMRLAPGTNDSAITEAEAELVRLFGRATLGGD